MRVIVSPAKKMVVDMDSFPVDGLPRFGRRLWFPPDWVFHSSYALRILIKASAITFASSVELSLPNEMRIVPFA